MEIPTIVRLGWPLLFVVACGTEALEPDPGVEVDGDLEGIEEVAEGLTDLTTQCTFVVASGLMTLELDSTNVAMISKASNGNVVVNGFACASADTTPVTVTSTNLKKISVVEGTAGNQTLILDYLGGSFAPGISGAVGVDVSLGGAGTDADALKIRGSKLADTYVFAANGMTINTDAFTDITVANVETFVVTMSDGNDNFSGAGTTALGGAFASSVTVYGGAGNDTIQGGSADDIYFGGDGDDIFKSAATDDGSDTMNGGANATLTSPGDMADYSSRPSGTDVVVTIDEPNTVTDGIAGEDDFVKTDVEMVKGGAGNDTLTGSASNNILYGGLGNDILVGGDGDDVLNGEAGNDTFTEGATALGADTFNGGAGTDTVSYAARLAGVTVTIDSSANDGTTGANPAEGDKVATDVENVTGSGQADVITGFTTANTLDGGAGNDTLSGGGGNDVLIGGADNDTMTGGDGDDIFREGTAANGADSMLGGNGIDFVDYSTRLLAIKAVMDTTLVNNVPTGTASGGTNGGEGDLIGADVEWLTGGDGIDNITGNALDNQLEGGAAVDTINGMGGADTIDGNAGADIIDCGAGDEDWCADSDAADCALAAAAASCEL